MTSAEHRGGGLALARDMFPRVFDRIEAHLGRPTALAGAVSLMTE